ncbi:MAG TPA: hypothetical protein VN519_06515 [Bryobacteraceae bacterium]|nr:hypothetical protein [Bryobacteraceae bacterium]
MKTTAAEARTAESIAKRVNDAYSDAFTAAFKQAFGIECETFYSFLGGGYVSTVDKMPLNDDQTQWAQAFSDGYAMAMKLINSNDIASAAEVVRARQGASQ